MDLIYLKPKNIQELKDIKKFLKVFGSKYSGRCSLNIWNKQLFYIDFEKQNLTQYKAVRKSLYRLRDNIIKSAEFLESLGFQYTLNMENYK